MPARYVVRYGSTRLVGEFNTRADEPIARGTQVIVRSHRGTEWGEVLCPATKRTRERLGRGENVGQVLREVTDEDRTHRERLWSDQHVAFEGCCEEIALHGLPMQLVDCERLFGGEKLLFYYLAENRVDFRQLVKSLARRFKTRIEMRQIGVRDEAKLLADYGDCGKPVCCGTHLRQTPPVSMKMAKVQKASLDPAKISGRCGRLKCCLRYEYETYEEHARELPKVGRWVRTEQGIGRVVAQEILAKRVLVSDREGRRTIARAEDILEVVPAPTREGGSGRRKSARRGRDASTEAAGSESEAAPNEDTSGRGKTRKPRKGRRRKKGGSGGEPGPQGGRPPQQQAPGDAAPDSSNPNDRESNGSDSRAPDSPDSPT